MESISSVETFWITIVAIYFCDKLMVPVIEFYFYLRPLGNFDLRHFNSDVQEHKYLIIYLSQNLII